LYLKADNAALQESRRAIECGYIPKEYEEQAKKMCEQTLKRFLHEMTHNMRTVSDDFKSELMSGAMTSIMKERGLRNNEKK